MNFECADMVNIYCASLQCSLFCITRLRKLYMADIIPLQPVPGLIPTGTNSSNLSVKKKKKKRLGSDASLHLTSYNRVSVGKALSLRAVLNCLGKQLYLWLRLAAAVVIRPARGKNTAHANYHHEYKYSMIRYKQPCGGFLYADVLKRGIIRECVLRSNIHTSQLGGEAPWREIRQTHT